MGVEFRRNNLVWGESLGRVYGVVKYPQEMESGWLSRVNNIPSTVVCQTFEPVESGALIEAISRNVSQNRGIAQSTRDPLTQQRAEKGAEDGERIMREIDQNGEAVGKMSILAMPLSKDDALFQKNAKRVESIFMGTRCKLRGMANLQEQALQTLSPYHAINSTVANVVDRIVPIKTFVGGFPFASSGYSDGTGAYFGQDINGGLITLDIWKRGGDRTNSNFVVMGVPGVGKSTKVKDMMLTEYMRGTKILVIDAEREYQELCAKLKGDWINAGGGSGGMINPLQIRPAPRDDEDGWKAAGNSINTDSPLYRDEGRGMGDMALHLKTLEIFFSLYLPSLTDIQKARLKQAVEELYLSFGIDWDTDISKLKPRDFPTFSDLYKAIQTQVQITGGKDYEVLESLLRDIAVGADRFLWNGHTSVNPKSRMICLDTHDLQNTSDTVKKTQYFNILTWAWEQMSRDRKERVMLFCDEAYLLIDPNVPQSLVFLRNVAKRARKYEAALGIISHSVVDFLAPEIKMYGQALLDTPCYKVMMGTDGKNLEETRDLYGLTEAEQELLAAKRRGEGLLIVGSKRLHAIFDIPDYKLAAMGEAGGR
ncbi:MAG: hypothetical protein LBQ48_05110 [Oscillospiraceae bacterium]|nr:hypothetical protein [Oscillospiraceae bacterium]